VPKANWSSEYLEQALKIFRSRAYLRNELARTTHKRGQMYQAMGDVLSAEREWRAAYALWRRLRIGDKRTLADVHEGDYDALVIFWSR
jgi:Tfp pilus assembly protein PilF